MSIDVESIAYYGVDMSYDYIHDLVYKYCNLEDPYDEDAMGYLMEEYCDNVIEWDSYSDSDYSIGITLPYSASLSDIRDALTNAANDFWELINKMFPLMKSKDAIKIFEPRFGVRTRWW